MSTDSPQNSNPETSEQPDEFDDLVKNAVENTPTEANTGLQKKFDSAEKQHKVRQENAVEVATKAAVRQVTKERDAARIERDRTRRNVKILAAVIVLLFVGLLGLAAHNILETGPKSNTATQQPSGRQFDFSDDDFTAELKALRIEPEKAGTEKKE